MSAFFLANRRSVRRGPRMGSRESLVYSPHALWSLLQKRWSPFTSMSSFQSVLSATSSYPAAGKDEFTSHLGKKSCPLHAIDKRFLLWGHGLQLVASVLNLFCQKAAQGGGNHSHVDLKNKAISYFSSKMSLFGNSRELQFGQASSGTSPGGSREQRGGPFIEKGELGCS